MRDAAQSEPDNFFHGVLNYILFNSQNKYNRSKLLIEYRAIQPGSDAAAILDYKSQNMYETGVGPGQCLVLTFHRIAVRPTAYAIKSGPLTRTTRHISSYVVQGWDAAHSAWATINERQNLLEYLPGYTSRISYVDAGRAFSKFRLLQTDPTPAPGTHIAISAFEIHGTIVGPITEVERTCPAGEVAFDPWAFSDAE
jgi:hypothetical protein